MPKNRGQLKKAADTKIRATKRKTRAQWAAEISATHMQTEDQAVAGIIKEGRMLIAAKAALRKEYGHGEFEKMIDSDLPYGPSMAQYYMKIARDPRFRKAKHVRLLPAAVGTLVALSRLTDQEFEAALEAGKVHPEMTRSNVLGVKVRHSTLRIEAPYYPQPSPRPPSTPPKTEMRVVSRHSVVPVYPSRDNADSDDDDGAQPSETPLLSVVPRNESLSMAQRIEQHGEAIMEVDAREPGYAAQLMDWLKARLASDGNGA